MHNVRKIGLLLLVGISVVLTQSCRKKDPSVIKVYVRSSSNDLLEGAKVTIIGDLKSNPPTNSYVDTVITNSSGEASFNMESYYDGAGKDEEIGYFDIKVKSGALAATSNIRSRVHTTAVETVYMP